MPTSGGCGPAHTGSLCISIIILVIVIILIVMVCCNYNWNQANQPPPPRVQNPGLAAAGAYKYMHGGFNGFKGKRGGNKGHFDIGSSKCIGQPDGQICTQGGVIFKCEGGFCDGIIT